MKSQILDYNAVKVHIKENQLVPDYLNIVFITLFILISTLGVVAFYTVNPVHIGPWITCFVLYWATGGIGITMGYHRLFSHKTFKANVVIEYLVLIFGSMALQNSILKWSSDHRLHHAYTDTERDPYNAKWGLLWSHILWIFFSEKRMKLDKNLSYEENLKIQFPNCLDLIKNPRVVWQHRYTHTLGLGLSLFIPLMVGILAKGNLLEYLLVGGVFRIFVTHQSTFIINSLAHRIGSKPHSHKDTSRDSMLCAFLAFGEGYHNFHHTYPNDYRNGYKFYHFDPTKWMIYSCSILGLAKNLKRAHILVAIEI